MKDDSGKTSVLVWGDNVALLMKQDVNTALQGTR